MIRIESNLEDGFLPLGQILEVQLHFEGEGVETSFYMKHKPLFYLRPLAGWEWRDSLRIYPESPGDYTLLVAWRRPDSSWGWLEPLDFRVGQQVKRSSSPKKVDLPEGFSLWAPSEWEGTISQEGEKAMAEALGHWIKPGSVVYDVGANLGRYAIPMARLAGSEGFLYCIEANPVCVQFLTTNLNENKITNAEILPVALLDTQRETHFTVNYGNIGLGVTENSGFYGNKTGHEIGVRAEALDALVENFKLRPPDVVKIDVEGVEHMVIQGMANILAGHKPVLFLELHGMHCALAALEILDEAGYTYIDPIHDAELAERNAVIDHFGDTVFQLVARHGS